MATVTCSAPAYRLATTSNLLIRLFSKGASAPFQLVNKVRFVYVGCSVSALFRLQSVTNSIHYSKSLAPVRQPGVCISVLARIKLPVF